MVFDVALLLLLAALLAPSLGPSMAPSLPTTCIFAALQKAATGSAVSMFPAPQKYDALLLKWAGRSHIWLVPINILARGRSIPAFFLIFGETRTEGRAVSRFTVLRKEQRVGQSACFTCFFPLFSSCSPKASSCPSTLLLILFFVVHQARPSTQSSFPRTR